MKTEKIDIISRKIYNTNQNQIHYMMLKENEIERKK